jgi:RNA polymerase sigma-70 factor (ECF subfamily)
MFIQDEHIIQRLQIGDEEVFEFVFNNYFSQLYFFAKGYIIDEERAKNIVQDVFVALWNQRTEFDRNTNLNGWLYTATKYNCLNLIKRLKLEDEYRRFNELQIAKLEVNCQVLSNLDTSDLTFKEIENIITQTLENLPGQCRRVFEMSRFEEKKNREIAEELGISIKAVEAHMTKALKIFRTNLKDYLPLVLAWLMN